ncbi:hypothetical protein Tco_1140752 [Tanacetum coccineum]
MGEPLSPDHVFDFPMDEPYPAYNFFAPTPLPEVILAVDEIAEQMDVPAVEEVGELVVEAEEEQVIAPVIDIVEGQMDSSMIDMVEDLATLFSDDNFEDDASDGFSEEEVWELNEDWLMAPTTPPLVLAVPPPSVYEVGGPSTMAAKGPSFPHSAPGLPVPPFVIEDLSTRLGPTGSGPKRLDGYMIDSASSGLADRGAAKRHADPAAADYNLGDEQSGEFVDAVYFRIG